MASQPLTRPSLLLRIRDRADQASWSEFVGLYAPLVYSFARRQGLQDADAADLVQDVFRSLCTAAQRFEYDPSRGTFRQWFFTVVRNRLRDFHARFQLHGAGGSSALQRLQDVSDHEDVEQIWMREHENHLFAEAAKVVRLAVEPQTWQAFWRTAVEGHTALEVASQMGLPIASVYLARSRITARLRAQVAAWESMDETPNPTRP
jgi:RNA polymerase sigma-70 factor (ECF subfamily)